jgi:hypothetical protein
MAEIKISQVGPIRSTLDLQILDQLAQAVNYKEITKML